MSETWGEYIERISDGPERCVNEWTARQAVLLEKTFRNTLQADFLEPVSYVMEGDEILFCSWDTAQDHVEVEFHPESQNGAAHLSWFGRSWENGEHWGEDCPTGEMIPEKAGEMFRRILAANLGR